MTTRAPLWPWRGVRKGPLTRFFLVNTRWVGVYLHRIDRPDADRECHDHPWSFVSLVLWGKYDEQQRARNGRRVLAVRKRWSVAFRHYTFAHRIVAVLPNTWTLVLRFRDRREWGFYLEDTMGFAQWVPWQRFVAARRRA